VGARDCGAFEGGEVGFFGVEFGGEEFIGGDAGEVVDLFQALYG